ncbi:PAS domain S-box protein [Vibrio sp. TRT 17S01]|uniref:PAS domain S-box protein n=1 Tax=Vibrio sp. TRT 17S01 TaxID=3418505 RepID=UPI003CF5DDD7
MGLAKKLTALIVGITSFIILITAIIMYKIAEQAFERSVNQQLSGTLELVSGIIEENNTATLSIAELNAQNRNIKKAIDTGINRGIAQSLNDVVKTHDFINYIIIVDYDGTVFAASTITSNNQRFNSEPWLLTNVEKFDVFSSLMTDRALLSPPSTDPLISSDDKNTLSQWVASPIYLRNQLVGWVMISLDWEKRYFSLLSATYEKLRHAYYPIQAIELSFADSKQKIQVSNHESISAVITKEHDVAVGMAQYQLKIHFDHQAVFAAFIRIRDIATLILVLSAVVLSVTLFMSLQQLLIHPITHLIEQINLLGNNGLGYRLPRFNIRAIDSIAQSINTLTGKIEQNTTSLKRLDLEVKEKERLMSQQQETKQRLEAVLDTAADGIITIDSQGTILTFNQSAQMIFGYSENEVVGQPVEMLMPNQYKAHHQGYIDRYRTTKEAKIIGIRDTLGQLGREVIAQRKSGEQFPIQLSIAPIETEEGMFFSGMVRDIGPLKASQDALIKAKENAERAVKAKSGLMSQQQETKQRLAAVLDTAADGIITIDSQGTILTFNQSAQMIFGYSENEVVGQPVEMLMPNQYKAHHQGYIDRYRATKEAKIIGIRDTLGQLGREVIAQRKSGEQFPIQLSIAPIETEEGMFFSGMVRDIGPLKASQDALIKAKENAELAVKAKSEFLAVMSHEIRTPMNGVIGMLDLLMSNNLNHSQQHQAYLAHSSALSLLSLLNDILDFSKIEANKLEFEKHDFDLRSLLGEFSESMAATLTNPDIELILDTIDIEQSRVVGDSSRIRQIFANLVGNAMKFTEKGEILIHAELNEHDKNHWRLDAYISDTGIGIPADRVDSLFDKFSQVDASTTRRYGGTGLGLAIVRKLCQLMDGDVSVTSEVGKGTTFSFNVLVGKSETSTVVVPDTNISELDILIVDDNAINREVLLKQLQRWGANAVEAKGPEEAKAQCQLQFETHGKEFDIAFLDMLMPLQDGIELSQELRQHPHAQRTKLIMMTSLDNISAQNEFKQLGFSGYFIKPATTKDLLQALRVIGSEDFDERQPLVTHNYLLGLDSAPVDEMLESTLHVLVVEDNRVNQIVITGFLKQLKCSYEIATNGLIALEKLQASNTFDLVLMDCQMPEMDGYEATINIRNGEAGSQAQTIPILAMTANAMESDRKACIEAGMDDFLTKPVNKQLLEKKLSEWGKKHSKAS